jgi:hypothetical protein
MAREPGQQATQGHAQGAGTTTPSGAHAPLAAGPHRVSASRLNIRSEPVKRPGNILTAVPHGTVLVVQAGAPQNGFYQVELYGRLQGFAHGAYLDRTSASGMAAVSRIISESSSPAATHAAPAGGSGAQHAVELQETPEPPTIGADHWSHADVVAIQTELKRIGVYSVPVDGKISEGTREALVEAFGSDEWHQKSAVQVLARLQAAAPIANAGKRRIRYGELFKDGVLDFTVGIGMDETNTDNFAAELKRYTAEFAKLGLWPDPILGEQLLNSAGRAMGQDPLGTFFVKPNAIHYRPPAGPERAIHVVVRLVRPSDGTGKQVADAFRDGMLHSDASYYAGHGRYGSGPDFDRNVSFEVQEPSGEWRHVGDYEVLEHELQQKGEPWAVFQRRVVAGTIKVNFSNDGNVFLNPISRHDNEFGGRLMYWLLHQTREKLQTGKNGTLAQHDGKYKVWVFDGCRTVDYEPSIRGTPGQDAHHTDIVETNQMMHGAASAVSAFIKSLMEQASAQQLIRNMNQANGPLDQNAMVGSGFLAGAAPGAGRVQ